MNNTYYNIQTQASKHTFKITFVGDSNIGKSYIIQTFILRSIPTVIKPTIFDNYFKEVNYNEKYYKIYICDTGGGECYKNLNKMTYINTDIIVICVDGTTNNIEQNVSKWVKEVEKFNKCLIAICLTKTDVAKNDAFEQVIKIGKKLGITEIYKCTAKNTKSVQTLFNSLLQTCINNKTNKSKKKYYNIWCCCNFWCF